MRPYLEPWREAGESARLRYTQNTQWAGRRRHARLSPAPEVYWIPSAGSGRRACGSAAARAPKKGSSCRVPEPSLVRRFGVPTNAERIRARDTRVIAAAWRLIARDGLGALTVKALAEEAGVAPSSMLYTLPNHAVVRERALEAIAPAIRKRISALPPEPHGGPERARALLEALLPLDAERRVEASVMQVLSARALTEPGLQPIWREVDGTIRDVCAQALRAHGVRGNVVALDQLHALMNGLINQLMNRGEGRSTQWVHAVLDLELQRKIEAT